MIAQTQSRYVLSFLIACFAISFGWSQVTFDASVSKSKLGLNERLRIDFKMNGDGDNFSPPSFEGFKVIGGPNQSVSRSWVNGQRNYSKSYSYFLAPTKKGTLQIGQASVEIDGEVYKTNPLTIEVTSAVSQPNNSNVATDAYDVNENLHLEVEISDSQPYLNEAVAVLFKLYIHPQINVTNVSEIESPQFKNFWSQNIPINRLAVERSTYKGEAYNYVTWKKWIVYPQKEGTLSIEPMSLDVTVDVPTNRRDFFGNRIYTQVPATVSTKERRFKVKPLPTQGRPDSFSGAVGTFDFELSTTKNSLKASESLQVELKVSGQGNLKLFSLPELDVPSSLEKYDPEHIEKVTTNMSGMRGEVKDAYTIVPQFQGQYPIPAIAFSYFNPDKEKYVTLFSESLTIDVTEGPVNSSNNPSTSNTQSIRNTVPNLNTQFRFIELKTSWQSISSQAFYGSRMFYGLLLSPLFLVFIGILIRRKLESRMGDLSGNRLRKANRLARKYLSEAKRNQKNSEAFYISLERALHNYLKAKLSIETSDLSKDKIKELLHNKKVGLADIEAFVALIGSCEFARYTPATKGTIAHDYERAAQIISKLDKQL